MNALLNDFIKLELTERMIGRIETTVIEASNNPTIAIREFSGNVYDLELNFEKSEATLNNILDSNSDNTCTLPIEEFLSKIGVKV